LRASGSGRLRTPGSSVPSGSTREVVTGGDMRGERHTIL